MIGLTGGIGSGKSTVAVMLAAHGAYVVDADQVARDVVAAGTPGLARLAQEFGSDIITEDGGLDRAALAAVAFADSASTSRLNAITHPLIFARTAELFNAAPPGAVVIHDVPLLAELGLANAYRMVIVVDAPDELRVRRLLLRGLTEADARRRITAQATREQRLAIADIVLENHGDMADLQGQVDEIWPRLLTTHAR
ncbi:MAG: dephospho-CoA kinase [Actinomycetes bacterium]